MIGGFYAYEYGAEVKRVGAFCTGRTDARGRLFCEAPAARSGNLILRARARDAQGNLAVANAEAWVAGDGEWWFDVANDDRMDVIPEQKRYEPGDTAVFQVRASVPRSHRARDGGARRRDRRLRRAVSGKSPVVKVPLKGNYAPNVFVSVLAVRGASPRCSRRRWWTWASPRSRWA